MTCGLYSLWPIPNGEIFLSNRSVTFNFRTLQIMSIDVENTNVKHMLKAACQIFLKDIKKQNLINSIGSSPDVNSVKIFISVFGNNTNIHLRLGTDESYKLIIKKLNSEIHVLIKSGTYFGARHGLETLRQLMWGDEIHGKMRIIDRAKIVDSPSFTYRGILLDTASHYIPVTAIKRTLNAMSSVKMNVFHWHMSDSFSFPFYSKNNKHAIYGTESFKKVYTTGDIRNVIDYAILRGIRVLIEIDNPGHLGQGWNWGRRQGYGDLNTCFNNKQYCKNIKSCNQINPSNSKNYKLLQDIFSELNNISGETDLKHLGGNTDFECWKNSSNIYAMEAYKLKGFSGVLSYHQNKIYHMLYEINKGDLPNIILWSNYFKKFDDPTEYINSKIYIAQVTDESYNEEEKTLINKGYRVIISHEDKWMINPLLHWTRVYDHRPWQELTWSEREQILGGEACLWTQFIDEKTLDVRLWPTVAALAEVLWSDPEIESILDASIRIQIFRERLLERGISSDTLNPKWCAQNLGSCL
ncbi:beta acetylhexosaminidase fused lobes isoform X2 [Lycorma delicatula]